MCNSTVCEEGGGSAVTEVKWEWACCLLSPSCFFPRASSPVLLSLLLVTGLFGRRRGGGLELLLVFLLVKARITALALDGRNHVGLLCWFFMLTSVCFSLILSNNCFTHICQTQTIKSLSSMHFVKNN